MKTSVVEYKDDDYDVQLTVRQCTLEQGMKRTSLRVEQELALKKRGEQKGVGAANSAALLQRQWLALRTYPDLLASTVEISGKHLGDLSVDMAFEQFMQLPEALVMVWEQAVYRVNPQYVLTVKPTKEKTPSPPRASRKRAPKGSLN